jgi:fatty-acyl-CoA synthase
LGISCWTAHKAVWSPSRPAIRFRDRDIVYGDLERQVSTLSGYLRDKMNIGEGDRVAFLGANSPSILVLLFSCARIGAIFVPLNSRLTSPQLTVMLDNCAPKVLFYISAFSELAGECGDTFPNMALRLLLEDEDERQDQAIILSDLVESEKAVLCDPNRDQNIPVLIAYTSGTTGTPKGAIHTQDALTFTAINGNNTYNMRGLDNVLTYLPMFHVGGLLIHSLPAMHIGAKVTIHETIDATSILWEIAHNKVTLMLAPPAFSQQITTHPDWAKTDLNSLRGVGIGSTFVPPEVIQAWLDRDVPTHQNYGMTEGVQILAVPAGEHRKRATSAGTSMLYTQARVVDDGFVSLPPREIGEIVLRGRSLFSGYWRNEEATKSAFVDGWFRTGDVAYRDDDGFFYIVDRKKNIVIVGSSNVYPADVERVLSETPGIAEAAVVGVPDPETGEALAACVRWEGSVDMNAETIRTDCAAHLAPYQIPKYILRFEDFPRTSLGKVKKTDLQKLALQRVS